VGVPARRARLGGLGPGRLVAPTALGAFVVLGAPDGTLGVAWPSMRAALHQPLAALGVLLAGGVAGYLLATTASGHVAARIGTRRMLAVAAGLGALGLLGYAATPAWWAMPLAALLMGLSGGALDAGLNAFVALRYGPVMMNLLHACYGVGTLVGPLLLTLVVVAGASWRLTYVVFAAAELALVLALVAQRRGWEDGPVPAAAVEAAPVVSAPVPPPPSPARSGWLASLWAILLMFFLYTGAEVAAGQWSYSLLTESRGLSPAAAGLAVSAYWGALTATRFGTAALGARVRPAVRLRASMAICVVGAALLSWNPAPFAGPLGLIVLGAGLAAVFPTLVSLTPAAVGTDRTGRAVGYQLAAASLGATVLSAATGVVLQQAGLELLGPLLLAMVAALAIVELARR
jgi:fucose permease